MYPAISLGCGELGMSAKPSVITPVGSPCASSSTVPPLGSLVWPFLMPSTVRAAVLTIAIWVPLPRMTGLSGAAASSSALVGRRFSANLFSDADTHATKIQSPFVVVAARSRSFSRAVATESVSGKRASTQSSFIHNVSTGWQCASIRPGTTRRPCRSMTSVVGPASFSTSTRLPTAVNRPSVTATASACGADSSRVVIFALRKMTSADTPHTLTTPALTVRK